MLQRRSTIICLAVLVLGVSETAPAQTPTLASLALDSTSVQGGATSGGQVTLSGPVVGAGLTLQLSSSNPTVARVPASVTVQGGATKASFAVTTIPVVQSTPVTISVTAGGSTSTAALTVLAPVPSFVSFSRNDPNFFPGGDVQTVTGGNSGRAYVGLSGAAPKGGGFTVQLHSSNQAVATVPSVTDAVYNGEPIVTFTFTTVPVAQSTTVTITATAGGVSRTAQLTVLPPAPFSLVISPATITGGQSATGHVKLSGPALPGGFVVPLANSNPVGITLPASVAFAAGATTASFAIATVPVVQSTTHTVTATASGVSKTAQLSVLAPTLSSLTLATPITGGQPSTGQVMLSGATPKGGVIVTLSSSAPAAVAAVPTSVTVPLGATTKSFLVATSPVPNLVSLTITAIAGGVTKTAQLVIAPPVPSTVTLSPTTVQGLGGTSTGQVTLNAPAPTGGLVVQLSSSKPAAAGVPASVMVPAGQSAANFPVTGLPVGASTTVTITATRGGVSATAGLTVKP